MLAKQQQQPAQLFRLATHFMMVFCCCPWTALLCECDLCFSAPFHLFQHFYQGRELKTNWKISNSSRSRRKQAAHAFPKLRILDANFPIAARKSLSFVPGKMQALGEKCSICFKKVWMIYWWIIYWHLSLFWILILQFYFDFFSSLKVVKIQNYTNKLCIFEYKLL